MSRKKILWLCSWYPSRVSPFNGDFIRRHAQAASLYDDIHVIHVIAGKNELCVDEQDEMLEGGLREQITVYPQGNSWLAPYRWWVLFRKMIKRYINRNGLPDIVHVQIPYKAGLAALWLKRKYGLPFVVTEHWGIYNQVVTDRFEHRNRLFRQLTKKIFKNASACISASRSLAEGINRLGILKPFIIIPNTTDTRCFHFTRNSNNKFRFIHVSTMANVKNIPGLLRAFASFHISNPGSELVMAGDTDPLIPNEAAVLSLPPGAITFRGEISYEQVAIEMQQAHCLLLFSQMENSPCVIGEALCCGLPVIATRVGGIPELVDESNSLLIEPGDEPGLVQAMQSIMDNYSNFDRPAIAKWAAARFSFEAIGILHQQVYQNLKEQKE